jgi:tetratricopeptide (TPR) repeat protein
MRPNYTLRNIGLACVLVAAAAAGVGHWVWGTAEPLSRPPEVPQAILSSDGVGMRVGSFAADEVSAFLAAYGIPVVPGRIHSIEANIALGLQAGFTALHDDASGWNFGLVGMFFDYFEDFHSARRCYEKAIELQPDEYHWHHYLGRLAALTGDAVEAEMRFRRATELNPEFGASKARLAQLLAQLQRYEEAEEQLAQLIMIEPLNPLPHVELGRLALRRQLQSEAADHLLKALALDAADGQAHALLSGIYARRGDHEAALSHAAQARPAPLNLDDVRDPLIVEQMRLVGSLKYFKALAQHQLAQAAWRELIDTLEFLIEHDPGNLETRLQLVDACLAADRPEDASSTLEAAVSASGNNFRLYDTAARLAQQRGHADLAASWTRLASGKP